MAQNRCTADEAFNILRRASQNRNVKINRLAAEMIHNVTGRGADTNTHWQR
jgi:AmiR/NasT family two-component response regulator